MTYFLTCWDRESLKDIIHIDKFLLLLLVQVFVVLWYNHVFDRDVRCDLVVVFKSVQLVTTSCVVWCCVTGTWTTMTTIPVANDDERFLPPAKSHKCGDEDDHTCRTNTDISFFLFVVCTQRNILFYSIFGYFSFSTDFG